MTVMRAGTTTIFEGGYGGRRWWNGRDGGAGWGNGNHPHATTSRNDGRMNYKL